MNIVATKLSNAMSKRQGYVSISDAMEENFKSYTFSHCLKLKKDSQGFTKWVLYWDDVDFVVVFTVITTVLSTGYVKATIIDRKLTDVQTVGEYGGKLSFCEVEEVQGKFLTKKARDLKVQEALATHDFSVRGKQTTKEVQDKAVIESQVKSIAEAWGITPKKN